MQRGFVLLAWVIVFAVVLITIGSYVIGKKQAEAPITLVDEATIDEMANGEPALVGAVKIPMFVQGGDMVCGVSLVYLDKQINPTTLPLNAAYRELFALPEPYVVGGVSYQNPIGYQATKKEFPKLVFERAEIEEGVASVYLRGSLTGVGTCYDPLPALQLDAVAKQFETVKSVKYYLNDKVFDPGAIADQR